MVASAPRVPEAAASRPTPREVEDLAVALPALEPTPVPKPDAGVAGRELEAGQDVPEDEDVLVILHEQGGDGCLCLRAAPYR